MKITISCLFLSVQKFIKMQFDRIFKLRLWQANSGSVMLLYSKSYLQIIIETILTFVVLLILTRLLGKKQMSHLTFFNYITGITIGSIAANMIMLDSKTFLKEMTGLVLWCAMTYLVAFISLKNEKIRVLLDGQPSILIKNGVINKKSLAQNHMNLEDLTMMVRQQNTFSISEIEYAVLEANGTLSVFKKPQYQSLQKSDMQIKTPSKQNLPTELIVDGVLIDRNLKELGLTHGWLYEQLQKNSISSAKDVFYAELQQDGNLYLQKQ